MKRSELERKTPLRRKTPIARKKPANNISAKVTPPLRKKKPSVAAAQYAQRRALNIRSGARCEVERRAFPNSEWSRCTWKADDPAHIYKRPKCGKARDLVDTVVHACRDCHDATEGKLGDGFVRIPLRRAQGAWDAILAHSRLGSDEAERLRIHIGSVGPRPEKGTFPYD